MLDGGSRRSRSVSADDMMVAASSLCRPSKVAGCAGERSEVDGSASDFELLAPALVDAPGVIAERDARIMELEAELAAALSTATRAR